MTINQLYNEKSYKASQLKALRVTLECERNSYGDTDKAKVLEFEIATVLSEINELNNRISKLYWN